MYLNEVVRVVAWSLLLMLALGSTGQKQQPSAPPMVRTLQGAVRGGYLITSSGRHILAFYNLPYAKPPVGDLRFRSPQPPDEWPHIRDATIPGSDCAQQVMFFGSEMSGSEDCLYLNVFTPKLSGSELLPVMFWVHGGGFGGGGGKWYGPDFLLNHDVVLITINYRLGPFGFLSTEDEFAPGNFGLKDQAAALRWVQQNIAAFGGDPGCVTVFGESAGAASVHFLALSPLSKGLLHRVIVQSGSAFGPWALARQGTAAEYARKMAESLGCPTDSSAAMVNCLRKVDDHDLIGSIRHLEQWYGHPVLTMTPVIEDENEDAFLSKHPLTLKPDTNVQWIVGLCENEGVILVPGMYAVSEIMKEFESDFARVFPVTAFYDKVPTKNEMTKRISGFYMSSEHISFKQMINLYSDALFFSSADEMVRRYKNSSSVFYYLLSYRGKYSFADRFPDIDVELGAGHTDDLFYLFPKNPFYATNYDLPKEDIEVAEIITELWTNFARTGNPTPDGKPLKWPKVTSDDEPEYVEIDRRLTAKKGLANERIKLWRSISFIDEETSEPLKDEL